jgi:hypothetical protein
MIYLIDRNKLYNYISSQINPYGKPFTGSVQEFGYELMHYLLDMEKVDAVPVVHAEWIDTQPEYHDGFHRNAHKCSNCGDYYTTEYDDLFFCPRCGAKMDGKKIQE